MPKICGIDLGTTFSLVGIYDNGKAELVRDAEGVALVSSAVSPVGGDTVIRSVKRFMGAGVGDLTEQELHRYDFDTESKQMPRFKVGETSYSAPELSALTLKALKTRVAAHVGEPVEHAVITVPARFNDAQRQATRDAGRLAGLDVLRLVNEPTAACLAYGLEDMKDGNIAVYDFGGGTFDISILHVREALFEVLSTAGNTSLGGDDMDRAVAEELILTGNDSAEQVEEALARAERLKRELTDSEGTEVQPLDGDAQTVTRERFNRIVGPIVERTLEPCRQALADSGLTVDDIDHVVLVGGSTRVPLVREEVERFFGKAPHCSLNPDEVVALGASIQAGILSGAGADMLLLDVVPLSLGIETAGGVMTPLISRNTRIPASVRESFTTSVDNQTHVDVHVLQGERELASDCRSLARFRIPIEPASAGFPRVQVTFLVDANGILSVTALDERTGMASSVEVKPSYGLSEDEIERMLEDSIDHAEDDFETRQRIETGTEADMILRVTRKTLRERSAMIDDALRDKIEAAMDELELAVKGGDYRSAREKIEALNEASLPLAELIMSSSIKHALETKSVEQILDEVKEAKEA